MIPMFGALVALSNPVLLQLFPHVEQVSVNCSVGKIYWELTVSALSRIPRSIKWHPCASNETFHFSMRRPSDRSWKASNYVFCGYLGDSYSQTSQTAMNGMRPRSIPSVPWRIRIKRTLSTVGGSHVYSLDSPLHTLIGRELCWLFLLLKIFFRKISICFLT